MNLNRYQDKRSLLSQKYSNMYNVSIKDENENIIHGMDHVEQQNPSTSDQHFPIKEQTYFSVKGEQCPPICSANDRSIPPIVKTSFSELDEQCSPSCPENDISMPSMVKTSFSEIEKKVVCENNNHAYGMESEKKDMVNKWRFIYGLECAICSQTFENRWHLCNHLKTNHSYDMSYLCYICLATFSSSAACEKHVHEDCSRRCCSQLISMSDIVHQIMVCKICYKSFNSQVVIDNHLLNHYYKMYPCKRPYLCLQCDATMYGEESFMLHRQIHNTERKKYLREQAKLLGPNYKKLLVNQPLFCYLCEVLIVGTDAFYAHQTYIHKTPLSCHSCDLTISDLEELNMHVTIHAHGNTFGDSESGKDEACRSFLCFVCDEYVQGKRSFQEHFVCEHLMQQQNLNG